jgi:hypothetical protein
VRCLAIDEISRAELQVVKQIICRRSCRIPERGFKELGTSASHPKFGGFFYGGADQGSDSLPTALCACALTQPCRSQNLEDRFTDPERSTRDDIDFLRDSGKIGIEKPSTSTEEMNELDQELIDFQKKTTEQLPDGRFPVSLPFRDNLDALGDNEWNAEDY